MRKIRDETGLSWLVAEGDPAWEPVKYLWGRGFRQIFLPSVWIRGGNGTVDIPSDLTALPLTVAARYQRLKQGLEILSAKDNTHKKAKTGAPRRGVRRQAKPEEPAREAGASVGQDGDVAHE